MCPSYELKVVPRVALWGVAETLKPIRRATPNRARVKHFTLEAQARGNSGRPSSSSKGQGEQSSPEGTLQKLLPGLRA